MEIYNLRKIKRFVVRKRRLKLIRFKDVKCQTQSHEARTGTETVGGQISDDEEEEEEQDIALKCIICIEKFMIEKRKLTVLGKCGHTICHLCCAKLMKNQSYLKCPLCRVSVQKSELVQPCFLGARALVINERERVLKYLRKGERNIVKRISENIERMVEIDSERVKQLTIPLYCSGQTLSKKRPELMAALCRQEIRDHIFDLNVLTVRLNRFVRNVKRLIQC